ncbi:hypothetical protein A6770_03935 [Nostoc minutum NIES-26]|uniref:Uncharacterized protein n=1 Tax=Nostoc minutum NIES-26 TaxID=1844469 RepID=A0A367QL55_9NOSO|nr:hypothetical protein A6770_03935 [Nostoc minutum NIES-26]
MQSKFFVSVKEKEKIFCTELVKHGVKYETAIKAARILASGQPDELLTVDEIIIVKEACEKWSVQKKRIKRLKSLIEDLA